jgi:hypothetical protein
LLDPVTTHGRQRGPTAARIAGLAEQLRLTEELTPDHTDEIRTARTKRKLSLRTLARAMSISNVYLFDLEHGHRPLTPDLRRRHSAGTKAPHSLSSPSLHSQTKRRKLISALPPGTHFSGSTSSYRAST